MLALAKVAAEAGGIALREVAPRAPGPGEILLAVGAAGICGTDMQIYHWAPRMARRMALPRVLGHEASGVVEAVGPGVAAPAVGDRVALESHIFCGTCRACRLGRAHLCYETRYPGIDIDGAFAERVTVPAAIAWRIPDGLPHETAAMLEPFGIAVHACLDGSGVAGQTLLVNGCGPIGLMTVAAAKALGARRVLACDVNPLRLSAAERMGADAAVDAGALAHAVAEATDGLGGRRRDRVFRQRIGVRRGVRRALQGRRVPPRRRAAFGDPGRFHPLAAQMPGDAQHPRPAHLGNLAARDRAPRLRRGRPRPGAQPRPPALRSRARLRAHPRRPRAEAGPGARSVSVHDVTLIFEDGRSERIRADEDDTIYLAALKNRIRIETDCLEGACATCKGVCTSGDYRLEDYSEEALSPEEAARREVLTCRMHVLSDCVIEYPYDSSLALKAPPAARTARVVEIGEAAENVVRLVLAPDDGGAEPLAFMAGQYVHLGVPGAGAARSYSFANPPSRTDPGGSNSTSRSSRPAR